MISQKWKLRFCIMCCFLFILHPNRFSWTSDFVLFSRKNSSFLVLPIFVCFVCFQLSSFLGQTWGPSLIALIYMGSSDHFSDHFLFQNDSIMMLIGLIGLLALHQVFAQWGGGMGGDNGAMGGGGVKLAKKKFYY